MVNVLVDLHLATARADVTGEPASILRDSVLARHGLSADAYERAMAYYVDHSTEYLKLYDRVLDLLNAERNPLSEAP